MKKFLSAMLCVILAVIMSVSLVACERKTPDDSTSTGSTDTATDASTDTGDSSPDGPVIVPPTEDYYVAGVDLPAEILQYRANSAEKENKELEFFELGRTYKVGDDNAFRFKPATTFTDEDHLPVEVESWTYTYKLEVKEGDNYVAASEDALDAEPDLENCLFDFSADSVGKTFRLSVTPTGLTEAQQGDAKYTVSFTFEVIDGYNAYTEAELGYISNYDVVHDLTTVEETQFGWKTFREEHGLTLNPDEINAVIMHKNMVITADCIPGSFLYTAEELKGIDNSKWLVGSLKDESDNGIYRREVTENKTFGLYGNYFTVDGSKLPYVFKMRSGDKTEIVFDENGNVISSNIISHATMFRVEGSDETDYRVTGAKALMSDIDILGNSPKTEDLKAQGGFILLKTNFIESVTDNIISRCCFITTMGENISDITFRNLKCYDSFNAPIYNWACTNMKLENCIIKNAGGPAIIADAVKSGDSSLQKVKNPRIVATNCEFDNPVTGAEAWFVMADATLLVGAIKSLDAIPQMMSQYTSAQYGININRSFLKTSTVGDKEYTTMNLICVVKDDGDDVAEDYKPYIEINGSVMDMGTGSDADKCNSENPAYRPTLQGYIAQACRGLGAPILESSAGGVVYYNGTTAVEIIDQAKLLEGDTLNVYYYTGVSNGLLGIMLEYYAY